MKKQTHKVCCRFPRVLIPMDADRLRRSSIRLGLCLAAFLFTGCTPLPDDNVIDPPDGEARYVGSAACSACHSTISETYHLHSHAHALKRPEGTPPQYPTEFGVAFVPVPPPGFAWSDISYVVGGANRAAWFVSDEGFVITDTNETPQDVLYRLTHYPTGTMTGFEPETVEYDFRPFTFETFSRYVTGAKTVDESGGRRQDALGGVGGTWAEDGVQCEACHGPGSNHIGRPEMGGLIVDGLSIACAQCHANQENPQLVAISDDFIEAYQQVGEVFASPHRGFACTVCHSPHTSILHDRENGLRNDCSICHATQNMAGHGKFIFVQGDYVERLTCASCHMPFATKALISAASAFAGENGARIGDTRTHVVTINTEAVDASAMVTSNGDSLKLDDGKAAVTVDYACLRCHNGLGSAPNFNLAAAALIGTDIHKRDEEIGGPD